MTREQKVEEILKIIEDNEYCEFRDNKGERCAFCRACEEVTWIEELLDKHEALATESMEKYKFVKIF